MATITSLLEAARSLGEQHGRNAGSWVVDGNTDDESMRSLLQGIEDGDPAVMDELPSAPLSGEWAGDPTPASVFAELDMSGDEDYAGEILTVYEEAFSDAVTDEVVRSCRARLGDPIDPQTVDLERVYGVSEYPGVAFRVDEIRFDVLAMHMIGDDRTFLYRLEDVTPLARGSYCLECGQIGCQCVTDAEEDDPTEPPEPPASNAALEAMHRAAARTAAARSFLEDEDAEPETYDSRVYGLAGDWLILTDEEADEEAREAIRRDVWAFVPSFLVAYMPEGVTEDVLSTIAESKCEDAAPCFLAMIGDRFEDFASDAISTDGRGRFLSGWDGCEHEFEHDGRTWYAYRQ